MKLARRDVRRGFFDKVLREKHALVARMRSAPPIALPRFVPGVKATERLAATGLGHFVFARRPDAPAEDAIADAGPPGALFVATDAPHFGGDLDRLARARAEAERGGGARPAIVLFDFVVHPIQIARAAAFGADAVVVQPGLVSAADLAAFVAEAARVGLEIIADVSTQESADAAREAGVAALLISAIDWDLLRARPLPAIDPRGLPAYVFAPRIDDPCATFAARVVAGGVTDQA